MTFPFSPLHIIQDSTQHHSSQKLALSSFLKMLHPACPIYLISVLFFFFFPVLSTTENYLIVLCSLSFFSCQDVRSIAGKQPASVCFISLFSVPGTVSCTQQAQNMCFQIACCMNKCTALEALKSPLWLATLGGKHEYQRKLTIHRHPCVAH